MRTIGALAVALGVMFSPELGAQSAAAQSAAAQSVGAQSVGAQSVAAPAAGERSMPYTKHHDTRFGHDHFYPDRGALIRAVPKGAAIINYAGLAFRFHDGVWYEPRGTAFMVVAPPIGLVVSSLPTFATLLARNGQTYIYCNDVYYRPRPDVNGYEVINDPSEPTFQVATDSIAPDSPGDARTGDARTGNAVTSNSGAPAVVGAAGAMVAGAAAGNAAAASPQPLIVPNAGAYVVPANTVTAPLPGEAQTAVAALPAALTAAPSAVSGSTTGAGLTNSAPSSSIPTSPAPATSTLPASAILVASAGASSVQSKGIKVSLVAKNGQDFDQQARDRYDCYRFAVAQSGFDPMRGSGPSSDYDRAQSACLEGRGYAVQ